MAEAAPAEHVEHDDLCPICQLLLLDPVRTQCNHLLCASCCAQWSDASRTNQIEHSSLDVNLADFDPTYDPSYDLEDFKCPMCRASTTASLDKKLAEQFKSKYPETYKERQVEEEIDRGSRESHDGMFGVMILIGNKHRLCRSFEDENQHDWTFFVRTSRPDLVKEVRINLHPTFRPPRLVLREPPFEVRRLGWGWFTIEAEIVLHEPYSWVVDSAGTRRSSLELSWTLDFEGRGRQGRVRAKVKKFESADASPGTLHSIVDGPDLDEDDEDDEDYDSVDGESSTDDEDDEEDISEYIETPHVR